MIDSLGYNRIFNLLFKESKEPSPFNKERMVELLGYKAAISTKELSINDVNYRLKIYNNYIYNNHKSVITAIIKHGFKLKADDSVCSYTWCDVDNACGVNASRDYTRIPAKSSVFSMNLLDLAKVFNLELNSTNIKFLQNILYELCCFQAVLSELDDNNNSISTMPLKLLVDFRLTWDKNKPVIDDNNLNHLYVVLNTDLIEMQNSSNKIIFIKETQKSQRENVF